jgi:hypothetical protein
LFIASLQYYDKLQKRQIFFTFNLLKYKAFIFVLCTLFYLVEYASVPRLMAGHDKSSCCHHSVNKEKKGQCPGSSRGCYPTADCSLNCPLCYVTVLTASQIQASPETIAREYAVWTSSYVYRFHASCWKPPNAA